MNEGLREKLEDILKDFQNYVDGLEDEECERPTMDSEDAVEAILEAVVAEIPAPEKSDNPTCPFCPQPKDSEAVRTVDELNKIGQDFWKEYMSMISMEAHPTTAAGRLHELWFDVLRHERERKA